MRLSPSTILTFVGSSGSHALCTSPKTITELTFIPSLADYRRLYWSKGTPARLTVFSRVLPSFPAASSRVSTIAVGAQGAADGNVEAAAPGDEQGDPERVGDADGRLDDDDAALGTGTGNGRGGGNVKKRKMKSLQARLNDMRLDFSLEGREPYVAGAPPRITTERAGPSKFAVAAGEGATPPSRAGRQATYSNYRRRKRPLNALCMPKYQRPQGCAPLLPPIGKPDPQVPVVDHVAGELERIDDLSEFKSDLPCVTSGTCPIPMFRCAKGHTWEANGSPVCFYCPVCADTRVMTRVRQKRNLEVLQEIARARGGECIAEEYLGMDEKIAFRCGDGHEWVTSPSNLVYKNTWCPKCAALRSVERKKLTIADMHQTARQFGGTFLSPEYHGAAVKHEWRCKRGHTFWNTPNNVRRAEGGRRVATFCKICNIMDRNLVKAAAVGGMSKTDAKTTLDELAAVGAMPVRRHFLKKRVMGKSALGTRRRKTKRMTERSTGITGGGGDSSDRSTPAR